MDLSPEDRQRIEEEERRRLAEERYRAEVRSRLQQQGSASNQSRADAAVPSPSGKKTSPIMVIGAVVLLVFAVVFFSNVMAKRNSDPETSQSETRSLLTPTVRRVPVHRSIASGQIIVKANGYVRYRFEITPEMEAATVSGNFNASGGTGNDIQAVLTSDDEFENWINGHEARVFYGSPKKTMDRFSTRLGPGTYVLAFSNKFSAFTDKSVFLEVGLDYTKTER